MEDNDTPPGFVRLRLITSPPDENIESSIVAIKEGMYISNIKWRLINFESISGRAGFESVASHGPCAAFIFESLQSDCCLCFHSSFWSEFLSNWKARCALHNWPPRQLFADIQRLGCHVVPIESKLVEDNSELEWRFSFSQAEKKTCKFHESHTISMLWLLKDISSGYRQSKHRGTISVFIFHEDHVVMVNSSRKHHLVS